MTNTAVTTKYVYDLAGNLLAEADGDNNDNITHYYIHGLGLMAMVTPAGESYTYHYNGVGSTVAMTDTAGNIVNKYAYSPFGEVQAYAEQIPQPFKFVGKYGVTAESNGLYHMRARYYDPQVGRFISEDPIGFEGGDVNLYGYVGNNPIMGVDPSGMSEFMNALAYAGGFAALDGPLPAGELIGAGVLLYYGAKGVYYLLNEKLPTGSRPINETPWSGDHGKIKGALGLGGKGKTFIDPDGNVWTENPDGSAENQGPASGYTGSGKPSGQRGKDREKNGCK